MSDEKPQFGSLLSSKKSSLDYLTKNDRRMRFNNAKDPIYFAFDYLENKSEYDALEAEVKQEVIEAGQTIKGSCLQACYAKGRVSWDTKMLDGYVVAHPEVEQFRKVGEPSVSIRKVAQ